MVDDPSLHLHSGFSLDLPFAHIIHAISLPSWDMWLGNHQTQKWLQKLLFISTLGQET